MPVSRAGRSVLCLTRLRCYRALYFSGQNPEVVREPAEQLSLFAVSVAKSLINSHSAAWTRSFSKCTFISCMASPNQQRSRAGS